MVYGQRITYESILNNIVTQRNFYPPLCKLKLISPLCWANSHQDHSNTVYLIMRFHSSTYREKGVKLFCVCIWSKEKKLDRNSDRQRRPCISYLLDMQSALKLNYLLDGQPGRTRLSCPLPLAAHFYYHFSVLCVKQYNLNVTVPCPPPFFWEREWTRSYLLFADAFRHLLHKLFVAQAPNILWLIAIFDIKTNRWVFGFIWRSWIQNTIVLTNAISISFWQQLTGVNIRNLVIFQLL